MVEIERKFLVQGTPWSDPAWGPGRLYRQGYLSTDPEGATVRVRLEGERAVLTIKGPTRGIERAEFEYEIPPIEANQLLETLCAQPLIEKRRWEVNHQGARWEVDLFGGENEGLVIAEIELPSVDQPFEAPPWLGREVSADPRYFNAALQKKPWLYWGPSEPPP